MSYSRKLQRSLKVVHDALPQRTKPGAPDRRVLWRRDHGDHEVWFHATKGLRVERRHLESRAFPDVITEPW